LKLPLCFEDTSEAYEAFLDDFKEYFLLLYDSLLLD
jgi:hypothetical protein